MTIAETFYTKPLYIQFAESIEAKITSGEYKVGDQLPNEGALAQQFGISNGTARKALDSLESKGVLTRKQGRGTFVCDPSAKPLDLQLSREEAKALYAELPIEGGILSPMREQLKKYIFNGNTNGKHR